MLSNLFSVTSPQEQRIVFFCSPLEFVEGNEAEIE